MKTLVSVAAIIVLFISCINQEPKETKQDLKRADSTVVVSNTVVTKDSSNNTDEYIPDAFGTYNEDNYFNNVTAVMCGLKGKAHGLNYLFDSAVWAQHSKYIDSSWVRLEKKTFKGDAQLGRKRVCETKCEYKSSVLSFFRTWFFNRDNIFS